MKDYKSLPYSYHFAERLTSMEGSVNECLKDNLDQLQGVKSVSIEVNEEDDSGSSVTVHITLKSGKEIVKTVQRYVDDSALELGETYLEAFWGLSPEEATKKADIFAEEGKIEELEPLVWRWLRQEYMLASLPHNDGGEFLEQDREFIMELLD